MIQPGATNVVICPQAGRAFTLCLQLQRVNRVLGSAAWRSQKIASNRRSQESRRCACSPKNYHSATLEAMNSVRKLTFMFSCALLPNLKQHCFLTAALHDISKARSRGGAAIAAKHELNYYTMQLNSSASLGEQSEAIRTHQIVTSV